MADCKRVECGQCLSDFRYFVNQQPAILSAEQTITPECPIGYTCQPADPIILPVGQKVTIPDVPPFDPDIDPNCGYECEGNIVDYDPWEDLQPTIRVWNAEQICTCQNLDPSSTGTASETTPANTHVLFAAQLSDVAVVQAEVNQFSFNKAKEALENKIAIGEKNCHGWEPTWNSDACATEGGKISTAPITLDFLELTWDADLKSPDGETCGALGYIRVDHTFIKEFGPFDQDMDFLIEATGTWYETSPFFANAIMRICAKTPAQVGSTTPPVSMLTLCSGAFFPGTVLLSWGGAEPALQTTGDTLPQGDTLVVLVGFFFYGQISGGPYEAGGTNVGSITFTPVP